MYILKLSRPFYTALHEAKRAHKQLHEATIQYQRATIVNEEAKRKFNTTEEKLKGCDSGLLDNGLQEILNIATIKVKLF